MLERRAKKKEPLFLGLRPDGSQITMPAQKIVWITSDVRNDVSGTTFSFHHVKACLEEGMNWK